MPSLLTRSVFRRLIANRPIVHSGCLRRRSYSAAVSGSHATNLRANRVHRSGSRTQQSRTFFNLDIFRSKEKDPMDRKLAPGIKLMMDLVRLQRLRARLPKPEEVAEALDSFLAAKLEKPDSYLEDTQATLLLNALRYCQNSESKTADAAKLDEALIPTNILIAGATVLRRANPHGHTEDHVELSRLLSEELALRSPEALLTGMSSYCSVLAFARYPGRARELMLTFEKQTSGQHSTDSSGLMEDAWLDVLKGFALLGNEAELKATLQLVRERGLGKGSDLPSTMLLFYIEQNSVDHVREWWAEYHSCLKQSKSDSAARSTASTDDTLLRLVTWCAANEQLEFGHKIVRQLVQESPSKPAWDAIFLWAAATGKGVDEIGRMFGVMEQAEGAKEPHDRHKPTVITINHLVEYAISRKDPYTAERFIALGRERGISPNRKTYVLQINYRLDVKDFDGALTAYKGLQIENIDDNSDVPAVNHLITALCSARKHDFDTIMNVVADLAERQARFEAETVAALAVLHMERHELHDVVDLLNTHAFSFSKAERALVRNTMVSFCLDQSRHVGESWDCYSILREVFDEVERGQRSQIMSDFLRRGRADMAVHVFNHMRQHSRTDTIPVIDTYISAFLGIANLQDDESLEVVHNQLKLDFHITPDTRLRNALIISYTKCRRPRKALQFWDDIVASKEGPNHNSLHIAFRACERAPFGDLKAQEIWGRLRKMNVELDSELWASFAASVAGNGKHTEAMSILDKGEAGGEIQVDAFMIGSVFAATKDGGRQNEIEAWATQHHPEAWEKLTQMGVDHDLEYETRSFRIDRSVVP